MQNLAIVETKRITVYRCAAYILFPETRKIFLGETLKTWNLLFISGAAISAPPSSDGFRLDCP
jgi:hypothetical protein